MGQNLCVFESLRSGGSFCRSEEHHIAEEHGEISWTPDLTRLLSCLGFFPALACCPTAHQVPIPYKIAPQMRMQDDRQNLSGMNIQICWSFVPGPVVEKLAYRLPLSELGTGGIC